MILDDIDAYAGMLLEKPIGDSLIGPTAACLISEQFLMLRDGDRFYYENAEMFSGRQIAELSKASLGRILCDSGDDIHRVPQNAFDLPHMTDILLCESVPIVDLNAWKDEEA